MSQFDQPTSDPSQQAGYDASGGMPRTSGLAVASLVCSLICCVPITTIPGVILGGLALGAMSKNPNLTGRGMAIAGIVLGIIFTIAQIGIGVSVYRGYEEFRNTPARILEPGFAGDYATMRDNFGRHGQAVSDEQAQAFIEELRDRYGELDGSSVDMWQTIETMQQMQPGDTEMVFHGELVFEQQRVDIEFTLDFTDVEQRDHPVIASMRIIDSERGDLVFPPPTDEEAVPEDEDDDA